MEKQDQKEIEKKIKEYFDSLNPEQLSQLKDEFNKGIDEVVKTQTEKLEALKIEKEKLEAEKKALGSDYGSWDKKEVINKSLLIINNSILNQSNIVKCFENGGITVNITDQYGHVYESIPDFRKVDSTQFNFDENNILIEPTPKYVPFIDEDKFKSRGYVFDAIRVTEDSYAICLNYYSEKNKSENIFIIVTLDQLVLIIDYYTSKAKAKNIEDAKRLNERARQSYFALSEEKRRYYMFQKGIYRNLSASDKKKVSESEFEAMDLEGREKYYLPINKYGVKKIVSKLNEGQMWKSFHRMYQDLINKDAQLLDKNGTPSANGNYANPIVSKYWRDFTEMINYKLKDIKIQREDYSDTYKQAIETSFGESNVDPILKEKYGILVKRQNGDKIKPNEIELIKDSWIEIQKVYGNLKAEALKNNIKISHSGDKLIFAMKALGVYIPQMNTIGVSNKLGEKDFKSTFSHEVAHFVDNFIGKLNGKRWATDDYESLAGKIAFTFRNSMNKNKKDQTDYINATKECFARAFQQYFSMKIYGEDAITMNVDSKISDEGIEIQKHPNFVNKITFKSEIEPMIEQFLKENLDVFETTVDLDGTNDLAPITEEEKTNKTKYDDRFIANLIISDFNIKSDSLKEKWFNESNNLINDINGYLERFYNGKYKNSSEVYNAEGNALKLLRKINANIDYLQPDYIGSKKWIYLVDEIQSKFDDAHSYALSLNKTLQPKDIEEVVVKQITDEDLKPFIDIVLESKDFDEAYDKTINLKGVPSEISKYFYKKYNPNGILDIYQTYSKFYADIKDNQKLDEQDANGIKIGLEFYEYYEPIKQRVVAFNDKFVYSVPVNEDDTYLFKHVINVNEFKDILSKQNDFEKEIKQSESIQSERIEKEKIKDKEDLEFRKAVSTFAKSNLEVGKAIKSLDKVHKINGKLLTLKNHIEDFASKISNPEDVLIRDIDGKPYFSVDKISYTPLINRSGEGYFNYLLNKKPIKEEQEENIQDVIDGLKILLEIFEGEEKKEIEETIEALKLLM